MKMLHDLKLELAISVIITGALMLTSFARNDDKSNAVRIGFFPNITHAQALVGKADGEFAKNIGQKIEWKKFNAGPSEIEALMAGEIDIGYIGPGPAISGYTRTKGDLQIIAGSTDAGAILVSRKDIHINNLSQLTNKKIAVPQFGNTQDLSLRYLLRKNGLKETTKGGTVEIVQAENPDIKTLFDQKQIDVALVPEPWGSRLIKETKANLVLDYNKIWMNGNYPSTVVIVRTDYLNAHPDVVKKFLKTHIKLTDYIKNNNAVAKNLINSQIKELTNKSLSKEILNSSFKRIKTTYNPEKDAIKELINLSYDAGFIKTKPDTKNLFNLKPLNIALNEQNRISIK